MLERRAHIGRDLQPQRAVSRRRLLGEAAVTAAAVAVTAVGLARLEDSTQSTQRTIASANELCETSIVPIAKEASLQEGQEVTPEDEKRAVEVCIDMVSREKLYGERPESIFDGERLKRLGNGLVLWAGGLGIGLQAMRGGAAIHDRIQALPEITRRKFVNRALFVSGATAASLGTIDYLASPLPASLPEVQTRDAQRKEFKERFDAGLRDGTLADGPLLSHEEQTVFQRVEQEATDTQNRYMEEDQNPRFARDAVGFAVGVVAIYKSQTTL